MKSERVVVNRLRKTDRGETNKKTQRERGRGGGKGAEIEGENRGDEIEEERQKGTECRREARRAT
jgi:hypothetical protein